VIESPLISSLTYLRRSGHPPDARDPSAEIMVAADARLPKRFANAAQVPNAAEQAVGTTVPHRGAPPAQMPVQLQAGAAMTRRHPSGAPKRSYGFVKGGRSDIHNIKNGFVTVIRRSILPNVQAAALFHPTPSA
jgi:hypothetical protein